MLVPLRRFALEFQKTGYSRTSSDRFSRRPGYQVSVKPSTASSLKPALGLNSVLMHPSIIVGRQIEMLNIFLGFEQANKYALKLPDGTEVGFIAEEETSFKNTILRQILRTRRRLSATVLDASGNIVLKVTVVITIIGRTAH